MGTRCTATTDNKANWQVEEKQSLVGSKRRIAIGLSAALLFGMFMPQPTLYAADATSGSGTAASELNAAQAAGVKVQGISLGMSEKQLFERLGQPARKDLSEYGFEWYIYNKDYKQYVQVGVLNKKVVALYSNAKADYGSIGFGSTKQEVAVAYGSSISRIKKGNTIYNYKDNGGTYSMHKVGDAYATVFYDLNQRGTVTAVQFIAEAVELSFKGYFGTPSEQLRTSFEHQIFDLTNAVRVRNGKKPLQWNDKIAGTAREHSGDMGVRSFFDHNNPDGKSPFDRIKADGIIYKSAGENIAAGQTSAIFVHENWMNSEGHRANILGDYTRMGVGVFFGGKSKVYYTENFYTPRS